MPSYHALNFAWGELNAPVFNVWICAIMTAAASVEILRKEVVVHKEMVAELRTQLAEKEQEFQVCQVLFAHSLISVHVHAYWYIVHVPIMRVKGQVLKTKYMYISVLPSIRT